jgi:hypothetical protein
MKTGRTLPALAEEIRRRATTKKDFIVAAGGVRMSSHDYDKQEPAAPGFYIENQRYEITAHAHAQLSDFTGIPKAYYDRCLDEAPTLLATSVNQWLWHGGNKKKRRMVRVMDGKIRAVLSDSYRRIDDADLAEAVLPILMDELKLDIMSCEITERRLYIKAVDPAMTREIQKIGGAWGDGQHKIVHMRKACPAITVANSEVGLGRLSVLGGLYDGGCTNLATFGERSVQRTHLGKRNEFEGEELLWEILSDKTKEVTDEALWRQVQDTVRAVFTRVRFDALVDKVEAAQADVIEGSLPKVVALTAKKFNLDKPAEESVLKHLCEGGSLTRFGLYNAVTRASQDVEDYDEASKMERLGGRIIELAPAEWRTLAMAKAA